MFNIPNEIKSNHFSKGKYFVTQIDSNTIRSLENFILENRTGDKPKKDFTIVINSSGGSPCWILDFASFIRTLSPEVKITGVTFGECGSAALALLQCCHYRIAVNYTGFFIHNVNESFKVNCQNPNFLKIKTKLIESKKLEEELIKLQTTRSGLSREQWDALARAGEEVSGCIVHTGEAKSLGLIDEIVDSYPIF